MAADDYTSSALTPELSRLRDQIRGWAIGYGLDFRSEEHTSELQSQSNLVCRLLLEKKKKEQCISRAQAPKLTHRSAGRITLSTCTTVHSLLGQCASQMLLYRPPIPGCARSTSVLFP